MSEKGLKASLCEVDPWYGLNIRHLSVVEAEEERKEIQFLRGEDYRGKYRKGIYPWDDDGRTLWEDYKISQRPPSDDEGCDEEFLVDEAYDSQDIGYGFDPYGNWGWGCSF